MRLIIVIIIDHRWQCVFENVIYLKTHQDHEDRKNEKTHHTKQTTKSNKSLPVDFLVYLQKGLGSVTSYVH